MSNGMKNTIGCLVLAGVLVLIITLVDPAGAGCSTRDQRAFVDEVKSAVRPIAARYIGPSASAASTNTSDVRVRGRCVLIGLADSDEGGVDWESDWLQLAEDDRALEPDPDDSEQHTVFVVHTRKWGQVGYYRGVLPVGGAYRARFDICVVYWPELEFAGMHTIISDPPEKTEGWSEVGSKWDVMRWVNQLPRDTGE